MPLQPLGGAGGRCDRHRQLYAVFATQAQWEQGQARLRALAQARQAAQEYAAHGEARAQYVAEIEQWLVEHPP